MQPVCAQMRILIFITHATLEYEHAEMTFRSLRNSTDPVEFDELLIYNAHPEELSNNDLLELSEAPELGYIKSRTIFPYDPNTPKCLGADLAALQQYCAAKYLPTDHILLLKSDCLLSTNFLNELTKFPLEDPQEFIFVAPLLNAKKSVTNEEITEHIKLPYAILSSEDTFYMEDETRTVDNDFRNRPGVKPDDPVIKYISCECKRDWSCHYLPVSVFQRVALKQQDWGGSSFEHLSHLWIGSYKAFVIHKYHSIVSENRQTERPGEWGNWLSA